MNSFAPPSGRILIAAGCFADAEAAIRLVDRALTASPAELGGLLMDDDLWASIACLPEQRLVTPAGAMIDPPSGQTVRSLRESDARAFRERLASFAHSRSVKWSFERRSGDLMQGACEVAKAWDVLLLGYRSLHKRPGQVVLITAGATAADRAHRIARDLAQALNTSVLMLSLSATAEEDEDARRNRVTVETEAQLLSQLSRINAATVVMDLSACPFRTQDQLRQVLDAARCPVVVLGSQNELLAEALATTQPTERIEKDTPEEHQ